MCQSLEEDFSQPSALALTSVLSSGGLPNSTFVSEQEPNFASANNGELTLSLQHLPGDGGYAGTTLQDSAGSSIDMDWLGISSNRVQANYYTNSQLQLSKASAPILPIDPTSTFVEYRIVWLPNSLTWYANGLAVRTVNRKDTWAEGEQKFHYPDQPARLSFSIWDAFNSINPGLTQAWAGTLNPYTAGTQFTMSVKSVTVSCYSNATKPVSHDTNATLTTPGLAQSTASPSTLSSSSNNLSNFGLEPSSTSSTSGSKASTTAAAPEDDLSKWLAGVTSSASKPNHRLSPLVYTCVALCFTAVYGV
ncbi:putative glycosidase CRH2 [Coemansia thaxteri]|nr:putative glycosidase CRH2 [Coemansia thaxteri]